MKDSVGLLSKVEAEPADAAIVPPLTNEEEQEAQSRTSATALVVHETIRKDGEERWGEAATIAYINRLQDAARRVATMAGLARACDGIRAGYRRIEEGSHVLLLKQDAQGILVVRFRHKAQVFAEDEQE